MNSNKKSSDSRRRRSRAQSRLIEAKKQNERIILRNKEYNDARLEPNKRRDAGRVVLKLAAPSSRVGVPFSDSVHTGINLHQNKSCGKALLPFHDCFRGLCFRNETMTLEDTLIEVGVIHQKADCHGCRVEERYNFILLDDKRNVIHGVPTGHTLRYTLRDRNDFIHDGTEGCFNSAHLVKYVLKITERRLKMGWFCRLISSIINSNASWRRIAAVKLCTGEKTFEEFLKTTHRG